MEDRHTMVGQRLRVCAFQASHFCQHIVAQHGPVEALLGNVPTEHCGIVEVLGEMGAIDEQFLGDAAADNAGPAHLMLFGDGDARAISSGDACSSHTPGSGADHEQVEVAHYRPALSISGRVEGSRFSPPSPSARLRAMSFPSSTPN